MAVVLHEATHTHQAVQRARWFVTVTGAKLTIAQRQLAVGTEASVEHLDVTRTIHRLDRIVAVLGSRGEHVVLVVVPVTRLLPQRAVEDLRAAHFLIAVVAIDLAHVLLDLLPHGPALGVPEDEARGFVLHVEQIEMAADAAVVPLFGLFEHVQVGVEVFLLRPGRAVDALQLFVLGVAAPVGAGHFHQLESFELASGRHVRATAKVDEIAFAVERHILISGNGGDQFSLVLLANAEEKLYGIVAVPHFTRHRDITLGEFAHALFDGGQVFRRKRTREREIVVEAVVDRRANGHLCFGEEFLDGVGQQVGRGVADDLDAIGIALGDDRQIAVLLDAIAGINQLVTDLAGQRCTRETRANALRHFSHGYGLRKFSFRTIRKSNDRHFMDPGNKKSQRAKNKKARGFLGRSDFRYLGRRDWIRTNDPHHVKVVL